MIYKSEGSLENNLSDPTLVRLKLDMARDFTKVYKKYQKEDKSILEGKCLSTQYPAMCRDIITGDKFAGRVHIFPLVGLGLESYSHNGLAAISRDDTPGHLVDAQTKRLRSRIGSSNTGYYFNLPGLRSAIKILDLNEKEKAEVEDIIDFWWDHSSRYGYMKTLPKEIIDNIGRTDFDLKLASTFFRIGCVSLDFDTLLQNGIPGMKRKINLKKEQVADDSGAFNMYEGMLLALDVLIDVCLYYAAQAQKMAADEKSNDKSELLLMSDVLTSITINVPRNTREALQLFYLYNMMSGTLNYGRMDEYIGDFYAKDIDNGTFTEDEVVELLKSLYKMMDDQFTDGLFNSPANHRIIIGGKGRRNEKNADRFALVAMEAVMQTKYAEPNVTLRFYKGQNPALMEKAIDLIGQGCIDPSLYNDDAYIPYIPDTFHVNKEDAQYYIPQGCGEMVIDHRSIGSPNTVMNYLTLLDLVLHNGYYTLLGEQMGLQLGETQDFSTFDQLFDAVKKQIDFTHDILARRHKYEIEYQGKNLTYLMMSMLTDDCIKKGKGIMDKGARYLGGIIESFGITSLSDSLYAIREIVYNKKILTLTELVKILDNNFEGYENERNMLLSIPKFGNDIPEVDSFHARLTKFIHKSVREKGVNAGLDYYLICNLNPGGVSYAVNTKASADGRMFGDAMAIGNAPTAGSDISGVTAVLNSMLTHDKHHAGYVHNLKVSKSLFEAGTRAKFEALLETYFEKGGIQLMVTTIDQKDLIAAMRNPEHYQNLIVRVGGWTSRFVELPREYQVEIINRTFYE